MLEWFGPHTLSGKFHMRPLRLKSLGSKLLHTLGMTALVMMGKVAVAAVHKSPNDHRELEAFKLGNDLSVLIISDPETTKSAAAMNIAVGSNADPDNRQGLAHFLEHMLFLGTQKYPGAADYQSFIKSHGGKMNAYTAHENTNYYFDISANELEPALDRFAQFFIAPLLDEKYVDRERHAVHSEYRSKLRDDRRRSYAVTKQLMNPAHSYSQFDVGSRKTLAGDVRSDLVKFYDQYYSSNMMTLVVEGRESLSELKAMVQKHFSEIPNKNTQTLQQDEPLFEPGTLPARLSIKSLQASNTLTLTFPINSVREHWQDKPVFYISDLVGYEGEGSLLAWLKAEGYATSLATSTGIDLKDQAAFRVKLELTDQGLAQQDKVVEAFFAYIDLIHDAGVRQSLYDEQKQLRNTEFVYHEARQPIQEVSTLAAMMQRYPVEHVMDAPFVMEEFNADEINGYLEQITPDNVLVTTLSPDVKPLETEAWYDTDYRVDTIQPDTLAAWRQPDRIDALHIRAENPYVSTATEMKPVDPDLADVPQVIFERDGMRLWHLQDNEFNTPKADTYFSLASPYANDSVKHAVMTALYTQLVSDRLNTVLYDADLAGISTRIYSHMRGFSVRLSGYNQHQGRLLSDITQVMGDLSFDPDRFAVIKEQYRDKLLNRSKERPYNQTMRELFRLLLPQWSEEEKLAALDSTTLDDLKRFMPGLFTASKIRMMTHGNLTDDEALELAHIVEEAFVPLQLATPDVAASVVKLDPAQQLVQTLDIQHNDSAISLYFQGEDSQLITHAKYNLLSELASTPFYHQLRTEKQLGYIVFGTPVVMAKTPGLAFVVQSPVAEPQALESHIREFVETLEQRVESLTPAQLTKLKQSVISRLTKQDKNLTARSNRFWQEIDEESLDFDSQTELANAVADLSIEDLKDCYRKLASRQLIVRSYGQSHKAQVRDNKETKKRCDQEIRRMKQRQALIEA